jgi:hypothetical protein
LATDYYFPAASELLNWGPSYSSLLFPAEKKTATTPPTWLAVFSFLLPHLPDERSQTDPLLVALGSTTPLDRLRRSLGVVWRALDPTRASQYHHGILWHSFELPTKRYLPTPGADTHPISCPWSSSHRRNRPGPGPGPGSLAGPSSYCTYHYHTTVTHGILVCLPASLLACSSLLLFLNCPPSPWLGSLLLFPRRTITRRKTGQTGLIGLDWTGLDWTGLDWETKQLIKQG